tara:strand:+ start:493 stop:810 length:318 start_codon:yes stop_codon:yes gene_type:complete
MTWENILKFSREEGFTSPIGKELIDFARKELDKSWLESIVKEYEKEKAEDQNLTEEKWAKDWIKQTIKKTNQSIENMLWVEEFAEGEMIDFMKNLVKGLEKIKGE